MRTSRALGFVGLPFVFLASGLVHAQSPSPATTPKKVGDAPQGPKAPGDIAKPDDAPPKERRGATGYGYSDKPTGRGSVARPQRSHAGRAGAAAAFPSFTATEGGGSRIVVHLSSTVPVEERKAAGTVTYILKGVHVTRWNDTNPLVTVHFNTPVSQARLVPRGGDLHLIVDLRASATPTFKMSPAPPGGTAALEVEFGKGDYVPVDRITATKPGAPAAPATPVKPAPAPTAPTPVGPKP